MNILLCAYACEPGVGSEPEVGWRMVCGIANKRPNDSIYVITKANNKRNIESVSYASNLTFVYYSPPQWLTFWKKGGRGIRTYYYMWMIGAVILLARKKKTFDVIHHLTFVNDWLPSYFFLLKKTESIFVWGPIGSNDAIDFKFIEGFKSKIAELVRRFLQSSFRLFDPAFYLCKSKADYILGINDNVRFKLRLGSCEKFTIEPAISFDVAEEVNKLVDANPCGVFSVVSVGRLINIKNFRLSLLAFSLFLESDNVSEKTVFTIVGDGPQRRDLEEYADKLCVAQNVNFVGRVPLDEVNCYYRQSDVFLFPSSENAGFVVLEAMSNRLPIVAMNYGGPAQFVMSNITEQLVSAELSFVCIAQNLADQLSLFYRDSELKNRIGERNHTDVVKYWSWKSKVQRVVDVYDKAR